MSKIKCSYFLFALAIFVGVFSFAPRVFASTFVNANITENTTWVLDNSPYVVQNNIRVASAITLTINPGVIVKFDYGSSLSIKGIVNALGTSAEPIYFTSVYNDARGGDTNGDGEGSLPSRYDDWDIGIYGATARLSLSHAYIEYSNDGLFIDHGALDLAHTSFREAGEGIYSYFGNVTFDHVSLSSIDDDAFSIYGGIVEIKDSVIEDVDFGDALGFYNNPSFHAFGLTIKNIGFGSALGIYGGTVVVESSVFEGGLGAGIEVYGGSLNLHDSRLSGFLSGNFVSYRGVSILDKLKIENTDYGVSVYGGTVALSGSAFKEIFVNAVENYSASQLDARQNFWGDVSGPYHKILNPEGLGASVYGDVLFDPWLTSDPFIIPSCCSNVLFLPGIEASRLYKQKTILGLPVEDQLWEPNVNSDVEDLYLNPDGTGKNPNIYTRDIIKETNTPIPTGVAGQNIYKSFADRMDQLVDDGKINVWKPYAYDWRQSIDDIVNNGTKYQDGAVSLIDTLKSLTGSASKNGKVTIIAHSNGGLLAKALLKKLQDDKNAGRNNLIDNVDVLILVAVPEIGAAKAVPAILHGYDQSILGGWLMDEVRARELGRNMISVYELLPSREYINRMSVSPTTFIDNLIPSNVTTKLVQAFGSAIDSYTEYKDFLFGAEGRINPTPSQTNLPISLSQSLFTQAENLHNGIDAWIPSASLRVVEVAGWGLDTVASFEYYPREDDNCGVCASYILDERPRFTSDGDKTVVVPSAQYMSSNGSAERYWVDLFKYNFDNPFTRPIVTGWNHANIFEVKPVSDFISQIIQKEIPNSIYLNSSVPIDNSNRLRLSIHSPVTIDAYDADGNHTGKVCPPTSDFCYAEENILNSSYLEFGEGKYLNLPEDQMSKVKLQGTDIGVFTYDSEKVLPDGASIISSFVDIPVTTQTQAEITLNQTTGAPQLALDVTGDGITDFTIAPNAAFDPIIYLQIMKVTIDSLDIPKAKKKAFNNRVDAIIKSIQKGKIGKAKLKAEKFTRIFEKTLSKKDSKKPKPHKLSKTDAQLLLDMLNRLLDNMN